MSKFFDSEIIQEEIEEINELQKMLYGNVMQFPTMERVDKIEHIDLLTENKEFLEKLSLSEMHIKSIP